MHYLLPRHMRIIFRINQEFPQRRSRSASRRHRPDPPRFADRRCRRNDDNKRVRMAHLCIVGSHRINGVSQLHSDLMVRRSSPTSPNYPIASTTRPTASPAPLAGAGQPGPGAPARRAHRQGWRSTSTACRHCALAGDDGLPRRVCRRQTQQQDAPCRLHPARNRRRSSTLQFLFDVQVKRIHEYKRQLLNVLHVITRYNQILHGLADNTARAA